MVKFLFFLMGVPMMFMSFFEAGDVLPYTQESSLIINGEEIVLSELEQSKLLSDVMELFEDVHTLPAFGVVFDDMYQKEIQNGVFVKLKFPEVCTVNELLFDELVFKVSPDFCGFNLMRGLNGKFEGRCIYIDLVNKNMENFSNQLQEICDLKGMNQKLFEIEK